MKEKEQILVIAEVAIFVGVAVVLDIVFGIISSGIFPWGGSISPAMLPIFIVAYRRGVKTGLLAGFIFGFIQVIMTGMLSSAVIAAIPEGGIIASNWLKLILVYILDYIIPFTLLGLAGIFKDSLTKIRPFIYGILLASFIRYISHSLSGVLIWGSYTEWFNDEFGTNVSPFVYSFLIYNLSYMAASTLFCVGVGSLLFKRDILTRYLKLQ